MTHAPFVAVAGSAVCLPVADDLADLYACLSTGDTLRGSARSLGIPHTDLPPVTAWVGLCPDGAPTAATRRLARESRLAVAVAAQALSGRLPQPAGAGVGTVWVSSTAGMDEYGQICVEAATLPPGLASPLTGPHAAYNAAAAVVSIRLGLTGPQLAMTGGCDAGASAVVEAARMLHDGQCEYVVVGGSAAVSRWRLVDGEEPPAADQPDPVPVPAEGAICLLLSRDTGTGRHPVVRPLRRSRLRPSEMDRAFGRFVDECLATMRTPPELVALSAAPARRAAAHRTLTRYGTPCRYVDGPSGDLGAAGGLLAVVAALAAGTAEHPEPVSALALALGDTGDAVAVEVVSAKE